MISKENLYRTKNSGHSLIFTELREQKKYAIGWTGTTKKIQGEKEKGPENLNVGEKVLVLAKRKERNRPLKSSINNMYNTLQILIKKKILLKN